jgi:murein tripeptide amidase MpaA
MQLFETLIATDTLGKLRDLGKLDLDLKQRAARQEGRGRFVVPGILSAAEITRAEAAGYEVRILRDLTPVAKRRKQDVSPQNRFLTARRAADMAARTVEGYLTAEEVEAALENLSSDNPDLVELIELPHPTWENRASRAVRVGSVLENDRPAVLFTGSMHAREWGGADICLSFLINMVNACQDGTPLHYGGKVFTASQVRTIIDHLNVIVFPDVNPDGKHYSQTVYPMWRKNRNPNTGVDPQHPGVDLNRNFDFLWPSGIGTSGDPSSNVYKGEAPGSEPEIKNVLHLFDTYPGIAYYVDIHSYSELILYSWGNDDNQSIDPSQNFNNPRYDGQRGVLEDLRYREYISPLDEIIAMGLSQRMNSALATVRGGAGYRVQESSGLYPTTATSSDYAFSRGLAESTSPKIQGWTIEFGKEFIPPFSEMQNIIQEVGAAMTELCWSVSL